MISKDHQIWNLIPLYEENGFVFYLESKTRKDHFCFEKTIAGYLNPIKIYVNIHNKYDEYSVVEFRTNLDGLYYHSDYFMITKEICDPILIQSKVESVTSLVRLFNQRDFYLLSNKNHRCGLEVLNKKKEIAIYCIITSGHFCFSIRGGKNTASLNIQIFLEHNCSSIFDDFLTKFLGEEINE